MSKEEFPFEPGQEWLEVIGAREHNLKDVSVRIPRFSLVVVTGLSGSGKSSLAFDTIFAEGQRRYMDTFSAYARQFIGDMSRPDVDRITGLSPVISIDQKTSGRNPRSTVGTITEIYDYLRLLYARASMAYSRHTGKPMVQYSDARIIEMIEQRFADKQIAVLAPLVKARKGHYRELFEQYRKIGFVFFRIDGEITEAVQGLQVDRYKIHDIELVVDRIEVSATSSKRLGKALNLALRYGKGVVAIHDEQNKNIAFYSRKLMCEETGESYELPEPNSFSFNSPYGACPHCKGLGTVSEVDIKKIIPDKRVVLRKGGIAPLGEYKNNWVFKQVELICKKYGNTLDDEVGDLSDDALNAILYGSNEMLNLTNEYLGVTSSYNLSFDGIINMLLNRQDDDMNPALKRWAESFMNMIPCPECEGSRLKKESLFFKIDEKNIAEVSDYEMDALLSWISNLPKRLDKRTGAIANDIIRELSSRIGFLSEVGLNYLSLSRPAASLSGGESQRIRLASQIGSKLTGVLYILDEPSIGLHQSDNRKLIESIKRLRDAGNSVIVVEHDEEMIRAADYVIDMGPGAGRKGGYITFAGVPAEMSKHSTPTCDYINGIKSISVPEERRKPDSRLITVKGATGHNLNKVQVDFPIGLFVCITGVSGSGKSSLVNETLYPVLSNKLYKSITRPLKYASIEGLEHIDKVIEIDQAPIGKTPRSNPATYTGVFDEIRKLFTILPESKARGYKPGRFSFNVAGGRCETCKGAGLKTIEMNFLPNVYVNCDDCDGRRYNRETLEVRFKGKSISDVLDLTINQAAEFFENQPYILTYVSTLQKVGLGYIKLGQSSTTLSGGEAQRIKLATELTRKDTGRTLYILDEPTTGLHFEDIRVLLEVLNTLVKRGNTVIVIEHHLDVIAYADYLIDLGPGGGKHGGRIVATGTPEEVAQVSDSLTGNYLKEHFENRNRK
ncbi:MAG: excinuclease ABC subunit A [Bacteroidetes bacterium GWF2_43_63]|nr:MAG: excinuclease ABC subunit A [Bacteroidetes bacterium GWE2_42_42]OFY55891.1 MAG: excinuclease ABC subunit A [Bacteroidetes bacterium GWF2_43_63]HCB63502.1 excinuclease ABC subunit UvrA [Bacteroidales bacterium]HCY22910.1 excinuclease ABC subunit UvrA [Bacteroidales bacterium]